MDALIGVGIVIAIILFQILREIVRNSEDAYNERVADRNEQKRLWEKFGGNRQAMAASDKADRERWAEWAGEEKKEEDKEVKTKPENLPSFDY